jgi:hypothetical protein
MSILAGLDNVFSRAGQMSQRQQANNLAERRLLLDEQTRAIEDRNRDSNREYDIARANGWLDANNPNRYGEGFRQALKDGNKDALDQLARLTNKANVVRGGGAVSGFSVGPEGLSAIVENPDGTPGAITEGGSNAADANVEIMSFDDVLDNSNSLWNLTVNPYQDRFRTNEFIAYREVIKREGGDTGNLEITERLQDDVRRANELEVLARIDDPVARREFIATINRAETPDEKDEVIEEAGKDLGAEILPVPRVNKSDSRKSQRDPEVRLQRNIDIIEKRMKEGRYSRRPKVAEQQKARDEKDLARLKKELSEVKKDSPEPTPKPKTETQTKIKSDSQPVQLEFDVATEKFAGKSTSEIADLALSGQISLSPNALREVAARLQAENVRELSDLQRLNRTDRAIALAAFAATIRPEDAETFYTEARNIMETGVRSLSAAAANTIDFNNRQLNQRIAEYDLKTVEKANQTADGLITAVSELTNAEGFEPSRETSEAILKGGALNTFWNDLSTYDSKRFPEAHQRLMEAMNSVLSQVAAGFAAEEEGGVFETIADLLSRDEIDGQNVDASDMFLNRIIATPDGGIQYIEPPKIVNGEYVIKRLDEKFQLSDIRAINSNAARLIQQAARANTKKYSEPAEV